MQHQDIVTFPFEKQPDIFDSWKVIIIIILTGVVSTATTSAFDTTTLAGTSTPEATTEGNVKNEHCV